jgi:hypothetical protein
MRGGFVLLLVVSSILEPSLRYSVMFLSLSLMSRYR